MDNLYVLGHASDPDGIVAHALARRSAAQLKLKPHHVFVEHSTIPSKPHIIGINEALEQVLERDSGEVIVADMDFGPKVDRNLVGKVADKHLSFWYDHHKGTNTDEAELESLGFTVSQDKGSCAAQLMREALGLNTDYDHFLANVADVHDFLRVKNSLWPVAEALEEVMNSGYSLNQLIDDLANCQVIDLTSTDLFPGYGGVIVQDYRRKIAEAIVDLRENLSSEDNFAYQTIGGKVISVATADEVLYMKRGMRESVKIFEDTNHPAKKPDFGLIFTPKRNSILLEGYKEGRTVVPDFCLHMGGGGRESRGGFGLPKDVFALPIADQMAYVTQKFEEYLSNQS